MTNKEAIEELKGLQKFINGTRLNGEIRVEVFDLAIKALEEKPQGKWIVTAEDNDGVHRICCPFCSYEKGSNNTDTIIVTFSNFPKFCENCGAKLKGGAE